MDTTSLITLICELVGGLGLFLLGMKNMSEGMQAVAGASLRRLIGAVTNNRFLATTVGIIVTCVVQSSSVTTVMVVGFVNSGVMNLAQAVGVIMGANIGTTITGWILVLKIGKYGLPLMGTSAFVYLFSKGDRWRYWAMSLMGIGMVFFGLELMKDACAFIKDMEDFRLWFQEFRADSYPGVLKCAMAGCVLTMLVQSSSATLAITISLAYQGVIGYETAAALVLGENIGTTITAFLASLGATTNARRAAYFHVMFNLIGVLWITLIFQWYIGFIQSTVVPDVNLEGTETSLRYNLSDRDLSEVSIVVPAGVRVIDAVSKDVVKSWNLQATDDGSQTIRLALMPAVAESFEVKVLTERPSSGATLELRSESSDGKFQVAIGEGKETFPNRTAAIAATHSIFNIVNTLMFLPFLPVFVQLLNRIVPSKGFKEKPRLTDLDIRMLETPLLAIEQSRNEVAKMGDGCTKMLIWLRDLREQDEPDKALAGRLKQREAVLDSIQDEIAEFVTNLLSGNVPHAVADEARLQLRMADEFESISDYVLSLDKFDRKLRRDGHRFTTEHRRDLAQLNDLTSAYLGDINNSLTHRDRNAVTATDAASGRVKSLIKQLRRKHLDDLSKGEIAPVVSVAFLASLNAYARIRDHARNIAESISGEK